MPKTTNVISNTNKTTTETQAPQHNDQESRAEMDVQARRSEPQAVQEKAVTGRSTTKKSPQTQIVTVKHENKMLSLQDAIIMHYQKDLSKLSFDKKVEKVLSEDLNQNLKIKLLQPYIELELKKAHLPDSAAVIFKAIKGICTYNEGTQENPIYTYSHELFTDHFKPAIEQSASKHNASLSIREFQSRITAINDPDISEMFSLFYTCQIDEVEDLSAYCQNSNNMTRLAVNLYIDDAEVEILGKEIVGNSSLTSLQINIQEIGDAGISSLSEALKVNESITHLKISDGKIRNQSAVALCEALKVTKKLTNLEFEQVKFSDSAIEELGKGLKANTSLTSLKFHSSSIKDFGATVIASVLTENPRLLNLDLSSNKIENEGAVAIANALAVNNTLKTLDLRNNKYGDEAANAFIKPMTINTTLRLLNIEGNFDVLIDTKVSLRKIERLVPDRKFIL